MAKVKLTNKLRQGLPICLTGPNGKLVSRILPPRGVLVIDETEISQDVLDKSRLNSRTGPKIVVETIEA